MLQNFLNFTAKLFSTIVIILTALNAFGQSSQKFSIEAIYGLNGNFFVRSYDELGGPVPKTYLYKKNFLGSISGIELKYKISKKSSLGLAFSRSSNAGTKNYNGNFNGVNVIISDFQIRHIENFYQFYYERNLSEKYPQFKYHLGLVYARMQQQEISLENLSNTITFQQRNYKNSRLEEGGLFFGVQYSKKIDSRFELGIKSRIYYLISVQTLEALTLTPTLTYTFK